MRSPFPGMDPYLEARWSDVHPTLITAIKEALQPELPSPLRARSEERVLLESADDAPERTRAYRSDVAVVEPSGVRPPARPSPTAASATLEIEPVSVRRYEGPETERFVQIIDTSSGNRVVTAIEVLSPWNKAPGRLNAAYRRKLDDYARADVSVVEIDLLRWPPRGRLEVSTEDLPPSRRTPYLVCVRRGWAPEQWDAFPLALRQRLPHIPIPLRRTDPEIRLDLQPLIDRAYASGGHDDIDYAKPPDPSLSADDATWASALARPA